MSKKAETKKNHDDETKSGAIDGEPECVGHTAMKINEDGSCREASASEVAKAKAAYISVASVGKDGKTEVDGTYEVRIANFDNGNIGIYVKTSDELGDVLVDNPTPHDIGHGCSNDKITLVGRGNSVGAAFALVNCFRGYARSFGQEHAYRMVKMQLDKGESKSWFGLFVPAISVVTM